MPLVLCNKPNRTKPRLWTEKDLARVAKHLQSRGSSSVAIVAAIAIAIGAAVLLCKAARLVAQIASLLSLIEKIAAVTASATAVNTLIRLLSKSLIVRIPLINRIALAIIVVLIAIDAVNVVAVRIVEEVVDARTALLWIDDVCTRIREAVPDLG